MVIVFPSSWSALLAMLVGTRKWAWKWRSCLSDRHVIDIVSRKCSSLFVFFGCLMGYVSILFGHFFILGKWVFLLVLELFRKLGCGFAEDGWVLQKARMGVGTRRCLPIEAETGSWHLKVSFHLLFTVGTLQKTLHSMSGCH